MMKTRLPWITTTIAAALALNPRGLEIFHSAFLVGEGLERGIWQPLYLTAVAVAALAIAAEALIREVVYRRSRARETARSARSSGS